MQTPNFFNGAVTNRSNNNERAPVTDGDGAKSEMGRYYIVEKERNYITILLRKYA
ncbi:hypothetical protein Csa_008420 [Cucumis sativus]|uniref:Uncharacterized protein n=1 Tax=Cucumis sativus TaxID=3659 RepID=A0A0A0KT07_CUCSA|nr:hypothetical protein Csa_008420 [Cucumis sativus]